MSLLTMLTASCMVFQLKLKLNLMWHVQFWELLWIERSLPSLTESNSLLTHPFPFKIRDQMLRHDKIISTKLIRNIPLVYIYIKALNFHICERFSIFFKISHFLHNDYKLLIFLSELSAGNMFILLKLFYLFISL